MSKREILALLFVVLLLHSSYLNAQPVFRADSAVIENLKSIVLKEQGVDELDKWRIVFLFNVKGEQRPSFFSSKKHYDLDVKVSLEETSYEEEQAYKGVFNAPGRIKIVILRKSDMTPLYTFIADKNGPFELEAAFSNGKILVKKTSHEGSSRQVVTTSLKNYYEIELLPFILAAFPFDIRGSQYFDMFSYDSYKHYKMEVRCPGVEKITGPAGEIATYRVETHPSGVFSLFSNNYIWYQKKPPHYIVRGIKHISWYLHETWELIKVDVEKKETD